MPNGDREVTGQVRLRGETWKEYEQRTRGREQVGGDRLPTTTGTRRIDEPLPGESSREERSAAAKVAIVEQNLANLQKQVEEAPRGLEHERYAIYQRYYEQEYLPARQRYESYAIQRREDYLAKLREEHPELTPSEIRTIEENIRYIQEKVSPEKQGRAFAEFLKPWGTVIGQRQMERALQIEEAGKVKPAWEAYYEATGDPLGSGVVKSFEWAGKGLADVWQKITGGESIKKMEPKVQFTSSSQFLFEFGEATGRFWQAYLGGKYILGPALGAFAKTMTWGGKTLVSKPLSKLSERIGGDVAAKWAATSAAAGATGTKAAMVLTTTTAGKLLMYSPIIGMETGKVGAMVKAGVPLEEIAWSTAKDVAITAAFIKGMSTGIQRGGEVGIARWKVGEDTYTALRVGGRLPVIKTPAGWMFGTGRPSGEIFQRYLTAVRVAGYLPGEQAATALSARAETKYFAKVVLPNLDKLTPTEALEAMRAFGIVKGAQFVRVPAKDVAKLMKSPLERGGISEEGLKAFEKVSEDFRKRFAFFGSLSKKAQDIGLYIIPEEYAAVGDIDIKFVRLGAGKYVEKVARALGMTDPGKLVIRAPEVEIAKLMKKSLQGVKFVSDVAVEAGTWKIATASGERLLDIHALATGYGAPKYPWGLKLDLPLTKAEGFKLSSLGQEVTAEWATTGALRQVTLPTGKAEVMFWSTREKDMFRFLRDTYTLLHKKLGAEAARAQFAPTEAWIKNKLIKMGFTEAEMARIAGEVAGEPIRVSSAFTRFPSPQVLSVPAISSIMSEVSRSVSSAMSGPSASSISRSFAPSSSLSKLLSPSSSLMRSISSISSSFVSRPSKPSKTSYTSYLSYPPSYPPSYPSSYPSTYPSKSTYSTSYPPWGVSDFPKLMALPKIKVPKFKPFERVWPVGRIERLFVGGGTKVPKFRVPKFKASSAGTKKVMDAFDMRGLDKMFKASKTKGR